MTPRERAAVAGAGMWVAEVAGEPVEAAARRVWGAADPDPLAPPAARVVVPDVRAGQALTAWLRHLSGRAAWRGDVAWTPAQLAEAHAPPGAAAVPAGDAVLAELARAVDHGIRARADTFPRLSAFAPGAGLPAALHRLFADLRRAGLGSRDPGAVASLERLDPPGLGQELLHAMGMMEGRLEALGWEDLPARLARAAEDGPAAEPAAWLVCGFDHAPLPLIGLLRRLAASAPVVWLVPAGGGDPDREALWPDRRSLAWAGAARLRGWDGAAGAVAAAAAARVESLEGPADVAERAVELALGRPGTRLLAADPAAWAGWLDEAAARRGARVVGERGPADAPPPVRLLAGLVDAWAHDLTAPRAADLLSLGARLGLPGWPRDADAGDQADRLLRARGAARGRRAVLSALGGLGRPLARAFDALDRTDGASARLHTLAALVDQVTPPDLAGRLPGARARAWSDPLGQLRALLEDLGSRVDALWPDGAEDTPSLLAARFGDALRGSLARSRLAVAEARTPRVALASLDAPLHPGADRVVLLGVGERDLAPGGASTHLIPDRVRAAGAVATQAHWPWHADAATVRRRRLEALLGGRLAREAVVLQPARTVAGREHVPWSGLPAPGSPVAAVAREPRLRPPPVLDTVACIAELPPRAGLGHGRGLSPSSVDAWRACPRQFYFERLLRASDRDPLAYDLDARQRGTWLHDVLRLLFVRHGGWWRDPAFDRERLREALAGLHDDLEPGLTAGASGDFLALQTDRYLDAVADALVEHGAVLAAQPGQRPIGLELALEAEARVTLDGGERVLRVRGTLDRLDLVLGAAGTAVGCLVFDWKTGGVDPYAIGRSGADRKVQLLLYAWLARQVLGLPVLATLAVPVVGGGRARGAVVVDGGGVDLTAWIEASARTDRVGADALGQAMDDALRVAAETALAIEAGRFPADPDTPRRCDLCAHALYCPRERR